MTKGRGKRQVEPKVFIHDDLDEDKMAKVDKETRDEFFDRILNSRL